MYPTHHQCSDIFKQGLLSSGMFAFSQMPGVTSSALVDFTCRCTWCLRDFPPRTAIPRVTPFVVQNRDVPNYGSVNYARPLVPKTFSPILVYHRPSFYKTPDCQPLGTGQRRNCEDSFQSIISSPHVIGSEIQYHDILSTDKRNVISKDTTSRPTPYKMENIVHPGMFSEKICKDTYQNNDSLYIHKNQTFSELYNSDKLLHSNNDSANLRFFLDTTFGCLDTFQYFPGYNKDVEINGTGYVQENIEHLYDSYLDLMKEMPISLPVEAGELEEKKSRKYKCPHCDVCCANNGQLKGHMRVHTGEKPFVCDFKQCQRSFARNEELTRHKRIHLGLKPHQCAVCAKSFGRKDHLSKHEKTHLKIVDKKIHVCAMNGCQQSYTRSDALARHQWSAHAIKPKSTKWLSNVQKTSNKSF